MTLYANATVANSGCLMPGNAHGAPDGTWTVNNGDSENWDCRWGMQNPAADLAGEQTVHVRVRKNATGGNGDPEVIVQLYESGTLIGTLVPTTAISSATGVDVTGTFDASQLSDISGAGVQIRVQSDGPGGMPAGRRSIQVDAIIYEEQLSFTEPPTTAPTLSKVGDSETTIDLEWNALEDANEYELYRDDVLVFDGSDLSFRDTGLTGNATYKYNILAKNPLGDGPMSDDFFFDTGFFAPSAPTLTFPLVGAEHDGSLFNWNFETNNPGHSQESFAFRMVENANSDQPISPLTDLQNTYPNYEAQGSVTTNVSFSPNGAFIATSALGGFIVRQTSDWSVVKTGGISDSEVPNSWTRDHAWSADSSMFAVCENGSPRIHAWNTSDWSYIDLSNPILNDDTRKIAFIRSDFVAVDRWGSDSCIVLDLNGNVVRSGFIMESHVAHMECSPDGNFLVIFTTSRKLILLDVSSSDPNQWTIAHQVTEVSPGTSSGTARFSWDSTKIAYHFTGDPTIYIRDVATFTLSVHEVLAAIIGRLAWSPNDEYIAMTNRNTGLIYFFHLLDYSVVSQVAGNQPGGAAFSSTGEYLLTGIRHNTAINPLLRIWNWHPPEYLFWGGAGWVAEENFVTSAAEAFEPSEGSWDHLAIDTDVLWSVRTKELEQDDPGPYASNRHFVLASVEPSLAPTLLTPINGGSVNPGSVQHTWEYNSEAEDAQTRFAFRRTLGGAHEWWDGAGWVESEVFIDTANEFVTVDWPDPNTTYQWSVRTQGGGGVGPYATPFTITVNPFPAAPTLVSPPHQGSVSRADLSFSWAADGGQSHFAFSRFPLGESGKLLDQFHPWDDGADPQIPSIVSSAINHYLATQPYPTGAFDDARTIMQIFPEGLGAGEEVRTLLSLGAGISIRYGLFVRPDGQALYATRTMSSSPHNILYVIDPTTLATVDIVEVPGYSGSLTQRVRSGAVSPDSTLFAIYTDLPEDAFDGSALRVLDTTTWNNVFNGDYINANASVAFSVFPAFSNAGDKLAILYNGGSLYIHTVSNWNTDIHANLVPTTPSDQFHAHPSGIIWSDDDSKIIITTDHWDQDYEEHPSHFYVFNASNMTLDPSAPVISSRCLHVLQYQNILMVAVRVAPFIRFFDMTTWDEIDWPYSEVSLSSQVSGARSGLLVWEVDGAPYLLVRTFNEPYLHIFGPDGTKWWNGTIWVDEETFIESAVESITFPEGSWDE